MSLLLLLTETEDSFFSPRPLFLTWKTPIMDYRAKGKEPIMNKTVHYGDTCEKARLLMKHIVEASEGPRKKTGTALIAEAMERTRFQSKKETPYHPEEYWRLHPQDLAAALVELLLEDAE